MNESWAATLAIYDGLVDAGWRHIPPFRELVRALSECDEVFGLTAVTSHEMLILSPYTKYPDWFEGRYVRVHPLIDGTIRIDRVPPQFDRAQIETRTVPLAEGLAQIRALAAEL